MYSLSEIDRRILLPTGFPAAFVRSPDCTTWRSFRATSEKPINLPDAGRTRPRSCLKQKFCLFALPGEVYRFQTRTFGRVSYIGAATASASIAEPVCRMPDRPPRFPRVGLVGLRFSRPSELGDGFLLAITWFASAITMEALRQRWDAPTHEPDADLD